MIGEARQQMEAARQQLVEGRTETQTGHRAIDESAAIFVQEGTTKNNVRRVGQTAIKTLTEAQAQLQQLTDYLTEGKVINQALEEKAGQGRAAFARAHDYAREAHAIVLDTTEEDPNEASGPLASALQARVAARVLETRANDTGSEFAAAAVTTDELIAQLGAATATLTELMQRMPELGHVVDGDVLGGSINEAGASVEAFTASIDAVDIRIQNW